MGVSLVEQAIDDKEFRVKSCWAFIADKQMPPLNIRSSVVLHEDFMRQFLTFTPKAIRLGAFAMLRPMQKIPSNSKSMGWFPMSTVDSPPEETTFFSHSVT